MRRPPVVSPDTDHVQVAGRVPRGLSLPPGVAGVVRTVSIAPERIAHIGQRRPAWLGFCLRHMPHVLAEPDYVGQRVRGDRRRVEFVKLVGTPPRWLLVSVKFLDDVREAWVNSAHPIGATYLTRRLGRRTMWPASSAP